MSPLALLVCILATIAAVPILMSASDQSEAGEVVVVAVDESITESALEADVDMDQLFEAGARLDSVPSTSPAEEVAAPALTQPPLTTAGTAAATGPVRLDESAAAVEPDTSSTISDTPATAAPAPTTTAPPTTAAPTTAAPTTAAPTTAAPTTAAPTTAAPTTTEAPATTEPPTTAAPATEQGAPAEEPEPEGPAGPTAEQWAALRHCESSGNYSIVSRNGLYHGAYQFYQPTWDGVARDLGRTDLVGVLPSQASPADQDALALRLWQQRGPQPWPVCGRYLPPLS